MKNTRFKILLRCAFLILVFLTFVGFRKLDSIEADKFEKNIFALLRNEANDSNSYALSKTIVDLENIGLIRCAKLVESSTIERVFYNTMDIDRCSTSLYKFFTKFQTLKGLNGLEYHLFYVKSFNIFAYLLEGLVYFVLFLIGLFLPKYFESKIESERVKNSILAAEKKRITDLTKQVSHDIASPISSFRLMFSVLKNIDPEVREILTSSLKRTESIIEELKNKGAVSAACFSIEKSLKGILKEKKSEWGERCILNYNSEANETDFVFGSAQKIERVFSNILNNAFESQSIQKCKIDVTFESYEKTCLVKIVDNGRGIPQEIQSDLGKFEVSFGKPTGQGIGVFTAYKVVQEMGGKIEFQTGAQKGTCVTLLFSKLSL